MSTPKLKVLADENMPLASEMFSRFGEVSLRPGREICAVDLAETDVLLVRSITQVNQTLLAGSPVRFVGTATIGTDHIDQAYLQAQQIGFSNAPGCNADAVVEYVLSCIFLLAQQQGFDPKARTYGIVGVGNVGGRLHKRLQALGYKVLLNDPPRAEKEAGFVTLEQLLAEADVICLHTPLEKAGDHSTYHLFGEAQLQALRAETILLNAGRGPVIDNAKLLEIGQQRPDLTFVLDVWEHEPAVNAELAARCAIVSPHIAGYSYEGKVRGTFMLYQALCQHLDLPCDAVLEDFLQPAELDYLEQGTRSTLDLITAVYDPRVDDQALRATLELAPDEQKLAFDQLRKQYRVRREFASLTVAGTTQPQQLVALGFRLADGA